MDKPAIKKRVDQIMNEGADIIDIGGFSSRPGAKEIDEKKEIERLLPALDIIRNDYPEIPVSIDTYRSKVARRVHKEFNIDIINDITGGDADSELLDFAVENSIPYIIMHMKGSPENMQENPEYTDIVDELLDYFNQKIENFRSRGLNDIIIDPGFGFGKNMDHNYELLTSLEVFRIFEIPVLVGISRKSMIYKKLKVNPDKALNGTTALHMYSLHKGANILRVHDVKEAKEVTDLYEKLIQTEKET